MDKENEKLKEQERIKIRIDDIERDLRRMQKEWITMYEEIIKLKNDN